MNGASQYDLVFHARRAITPTGERPVTVAVRGGTIAAIEPFDTDLPAARTVTLRDDEVLLPGMVDTHVHVNEPGRTEWEGFASATRAAAAGGVTTIIDMPLNSLPPTVDVPALQVKRAVAAEKAYVDVGFWGGAIPGNIGSLKGLHEAGVFGFKCFLLDSGVPEFPPLMPADLHDYLTAIREFDGLMIVHAEDAESIEHSPAAHGSRYAEFLRSRPRGAENTAIAHVIEAARWTGARVHILHLSSSDALPMIASAKRDGVRLTVETCPHYLVFDADEIAAGATQFKCCPPIREPENRDLLWQGLWPTASSTASCPTTPPAPRNSSGWTPATSASPGAASPACRSPCPRCGPRPAPAGSPWPTSPAGCPRRPPRSPAWTARAA